MESSTTVSYYIPQYLKERIEEEAKKLDRSASWVVANVLSKHFEGLDITLAAAKNQVADSKTQAKATR
jgi:predicted DNA-binding protein